MLAFAGCGLGLLTAAFLPVGVLVASGVGTAALLLAGIFLQVRFVCGLVERIVIRERGTRARSTEILGNLLDRGADIAVFVAAGYSIGGGVIGPMLGWMAAVLCVATSYVGLLSSAPVLLEAATYPMNQRHRMAVMTAACVIAAILPAGLRPFAMYLAMVVVVLGCGFALWLKVPRLVKDPI
jgi:hypothetical protein